MKVTVDINLTPQQLAAAFCELDDERQADFFIECARIAAAWRSHPVPPGALPNLGADWQWWKVGRHLKSCACSTDDAREMVRAIASGLEATT